MTSTIDAGPCRCRCRCHCAPFSRRVESATAGQGCWQGSAGLLLLARHGVSGCVPGPSRSSASSLPAPASAQPARPPAPAPVPLALAIGARASDCFRSASCDAHTNLAPLERCCINNGYFASMASHPISVHVSVFSSHRDAHHSSPVPASHHSSPAPFSHRSSLVPVLRPAVPT